MCTFYIKIFSNEERITCYKKETNLLKINGDPFYMFVLGWWLSMNPKDSFLNRIQPISDIVSLMDRNNRFQSGAESKNTLGCIVVSGSQCKLVLSKKTNI